MEREGVGSEERVGGVHAWLQEHLQASLVVEYATLLIAVVTALFGIFLAWFGYLERTRYKEIQKDLTEQRQTLLEEARTLDTKVEEFKVNLKSHEQRLGSNQRFFEAVLSHHSELLIGIVEGFRSVLNPDEDRRLRSLISEAEAALNLFYPDKEEVFKALLRLELIGADNAVPSLVRLRDDSAADSDIRVRAQIVLSKIQTRLKEERKKTVGHLPVDESRDRPDGQAGLGNPQPTSPRRKRSARVPT